MGPADVLKLPGAEQQLRQRQKRLVLTHAFFHLTTLCMPGNAETVLFRQLVGGDLVQADRLLALTMSANAMIEFCLGPTRSAASPTPSGGARSSSATRSTARWS
jgi:hypothetical protein